MIGGPIASARAAVIAAALACWSSAALAAEAPAKRPDFNGVWTQTKFIGTLKTLKGSLPPLKPEALALYRQRVADRAAGKPVKDPIDDCVPHGVPRLMYAPYPMLFLQRPEQLSVVQQANHTQRWIYIDQKLPEDGDPKWLGDSVARWEGSTLVVTTINQNAQTWLNKAGLPHSEAMKVTERLRLLPGGKTMQNTVTIDDPQTYTAPWTTVVTFQKRPGMRLQEQVCVRDHKM